MLAAIWIIWLIATVKDVIDAYKRFGFCFDLYDYLDVYSQAFIVVTLVVLFLASLASWLSQLG